MVPPLPYVLSAFILRRCSHSTLPVFFKIIFYIYWFTYYLCGGVLCYGTYIEVRGQQLGVGSLFLPRGSEDQIQVVRLGDEFLNPPSHQASPIYSISNPSLPSTSQSTQTSTLTRNFITMRLEGTLTQVKQRWGCVPYSNCWQQRTRA